MHVRNELLDERRVSSILREVIRDYGLFMTRFRTFGITVKKHGISVLSVLESVIRRVGPIDHC